ncbi:uncharacterized protein LOC110347986 [Heterocephalus glaber]|uniref:Uncharacterized protein LOC110347986 n=1 Tax=Heterocephalus glaber TaxID=10181 RepID=A0AAX6SNU8_HETGA|nr:uncharacterized protein LOC110347986 [Heterocephalus glaber]
MPPPSSWSTKRPKGSLQPRRRSVNTHISFRTTVASSPKPANASPRGAHFSEEPWHRPLPRLAPPPPSPPPPSRGLAGGGDSRRPLPAAALREVAVSPGPAGLMIRLSLPGRPGRGEGAGAGESGRAGVGTGTGEGTRAAATEAEAAAAALRARCSLPSPPARWG